MDLKRHLAALNPLQNSCQITRVKCHVGNEVISQIVKTLNSFVKRRISLTTKYFNSQTKLLRHLGPTYSMGHFDKSARRYFALLRAQ